MNRTRKLMSIGAVLAVACIGGGVVIRPAVGGSSEERVTGSQAERARQAALELVGRSEVAGVERAEGGAGWEVEVIKRGERLGPWWDDAVSKHHIVVQLNRDFEWTSARAVDGGAGDARPGDAPDDH
jgi:hypothetical protein